MPHLSIQVGSVASKEPFHDYRNQQKEDFECRKYLSIKTIGIFLLIAFVICSYSLPTGEIMRPSIFRLVKDCSEVFSISVLSSESVTITE